MSSGGFPELYLISRNILGVCLGFCFLGFFLKGHSLKINAKNVQGFIMEFV